MHDLPSTVYLSLLKSIKIDLVSERQVKVFQITVPPKNTPKNLSLDISADYRVLLERVIFVRTVVRVTPFLLPPIPTADLSQNGPVQSRALPEALALVSYRYNSLMY